MDINSIGTVIRSGLSTPAATPTATQAPPPAGKSAAAPVEATAAVQQPVSVPSMSQLSEAIKNINKALESQSQGLEFSIDDDSKRTIVKVIDQRTKEIIRQIPGEEVLQIAKALDQLQGLLIKQKA